MKNRSKNLKETKQKMPKLEDKRQKGITLIALVITVIVLLILAGTAITLSINGGNLFSKTNEAATKWNEAVIKEETTIKNYLAYLEVDPAKEYGYENNEGVVEASALVEGDIINYYYNKEEAPIPCAVLYNDRTHGLQAVALDSVRDVILGYDETSNDPKAEEAFANGVPSGYSNTDLTFEKARWSYNHALQTLKEYAMEYMGEMAINARCLGAPDNAIIADDTMYKADEGYEFFSSYNGKFKISNDWHSSEELNKMDSIGILQSAKSETYWIASRIVKITHPENTTIYGVGFHLHCVNEEGKIGTRGVFNVGTTNGETQNMRACLGFRIGFRPIFTLRDNIKVEKTGHLD